MKNKQSKLWIRILSPKIRRIFRFRLQSLIYILNNLFRNDPSLIKSGGEESLKTHMLVFKAEESRKQNLVNKPTPININ